MQISKYANVALAQPSKDRQAAINVYDRARELCESLGEPCKACCAAAMVEWLKREHPILYKRNAPV